MKAKRLIKTIVKSVGLVRLLRGVTDTRKKYQIELPKIVLPVIMRSFIGVKSTNQLDAFLKTKYAIDLFGSKGRKRKMVCSTSTIARAMKNIKAEELLQILAHIAGIAKQRGWWKGYKGKEIASIDGSFVGKQFAVCMEIAGKKGFLLDWKDCGKGKEFPTAIEILQRQLKKHRDIKIVVADGLYLKEKFFTTCGEHNRTAVCKYTPKEGKRKPVILQEVDKIIEAGLVRPESFTDAGRNEEVTIWEVKGCIHSVVKDITVIKVREEGIRSKKKKASEYYVVVKDEGRVGFTARNYREVAKGEGRWHIELDVFRTMNQTMNSKRRFFKDENAQRNITTTTFIAYNLFGLYECEWSDKDNSADCRLKRHSNNRVNLFKIIHRELMVLIATSHVNIFEINSS